jgi:hypothetical protein
VGRYEASVIETFVPDGTDANAGADFFVVAAFAETTEQALRPIMAIAMSFLVVERLRRSPLDLVLALAVVELLNMNCATFLLENEMKPR